MLYFSRESLVTVGMEGVEPSSLTAHASETCVSSQLHHMPMIMSNMLPPRVELGINASKAFVISISPRERGVL